jgi:hypothetical protein
MSDGLGPTPEPAVYSSTGKRKRFGLVAQKIGMTSLWDAWGQHRAATVLQVLRELNFNFRLWIIK